MSEDILSAAYVAQLTAERDAWRGRAERAEAAAVGLREAVVDSALAAERCRIALRLAADPRWHGDRADAMGMMLEEKEGD